jgi:acetyl esterase/lipase
MHAAVIIFPGGGYARLAIQHEGYDIAKELSKRGITAFVLKYRLPIDSACTDDREDVAFIDAQQAIKIVRTGATEWGINPEKIGILGLSAGGHLAAFMGTHFNKSLIDDAIVSNLRPDFLILGYPVISFTDSLGHSGSRKNMLGHHISAEKKEYYSNELHVSANTPPSFIFHAANDDHVSVMNSIAFFTALQKNQVPVEMHIIQKGGHGFGLNDAEESFDWIQLVFKWLKTNKFLSKEGF